MKTGKSIITFLFIAKREIFDFSKNYIIRGPRQIAKTVFLYRLMNEITNKEISDPESITYVSCHRLGRRKELRNLIRELKEIMREKSKEKQNILTFLRILECAELEEEMFSRS